MTARPSQWYETPDLHGDHVTLTQLRPHHAEGVLAAADDDSVFEWLPVHRPDGLADAQDVIEDYLSGKDTVAWAQFDMASGDLAGLTTCYDIDPARRTLAIGSTWLGKRFHRTAINTEAKLLLLRRAFDELAAVRVVWHVDLGDEQSQQTVERLGAAREGVLRKHQNAKDGSWHDTALFAMTDDDWPEAAKQLRARLTDGAREG